MIYIVDLQTGELIAEMMGDAKDTALRLLSERKRSGLDCTIAENAVGYVLIERLSDERIKPLIAIRTKPPFSYKKLWERYRPLIEGILLVLFVEIALATFGRSLPGLKALKKDLWRTL